MKARLFDSITLGYLILVALYVGGVSRENFSTNVTLAVVCLFLGFWISFLLSKIKIKSLGRYIFDPPYKKARFAAIPWYMTFYGAQLFVLFTVTFVLGLKVTNFSIYELTDPDGLGGAVKILKSLFNPELSVLPEGVNSIFETIAIAFMATTIAVPMAFVLSFACAKNIMATGPIGFVIYILLRALLNIVRSIEPLIWAIVFTVWVGIGPFAGMMALMIHSVASLAKQYSEFIECVNDGPIEGIQSTGASKMQVVWFAVVPQIVLPYISFTIYRWDINVRMATIIGLVGGGGIGTMLIQYQGQALWREVGTLAILIVIAVWIMDTASAYIREAIK